MHVASWNANYLKQANVEAVFDNFMHEARSDIVLIQESGALCQEWTSDATACVVFGGCVGLFFRHERAC